MPVWWRDYPHEQTLKFPVSEAKNIDLHQRMAALGLREEDIGESYFKTVKSGGKAGLIGVMLHHPASGIRVRCPRERSQGINRFLARRMLVEQLEKKARRAAPLAKPVSIHLPQTILLPKPPAHWGMEVGDAPINSGISIPIEISLTCRQKKARSAPAMPKK